MRLFKLLDSEKSGRILISDIRKLFDNNFSLSNISTQHLNYAKSPYLSATSGLLTKGQMS